MHELGKKAYAAISRGNFDEAGALYKDMQKVSGELSKAIDAVLSIQVKTDFSDFMKQRTAEGLGAVRRKK